MFQSSAGFTPSSAVDGMVFEKNGDPSVRDFLLRALNTLFVLLFYVYLFLFPFASLRLTYLRAGSGTRKDERWRRRRPATRAPRRDRRRRSRRRRRRTTRGTPSPSSSRRPLGGRRRFGSMEFLLRFCPLLFIFAFLCSDFLFSTSAYDCELG